MNPINSVKITQSSHISIIIQSGDIEIRTVILPEHNIINLSYSGIILWQYFT